MMRVASLSVTKTLEIFVLPQIIEDLSCKASHWFFSAGLSLHNGEEILSTAVDSTNFYIALTGLEDRSAKSTESLWKEVISYKPKTALGQKLWKIRERILTSGEPLLTWEEIDQEIATQRGEME